MKPAHILHLAGHRVKRFGQSRMQAIPLDAADKFPASDHDAEVAGLRLRVPETRGSGSSFPPDGSLRSTTGLCGEIH